MSSETRTTPAPFDLALVERGECASSVTPQVLFNSDYRIYIGCGVASYRCAFALVLCYALPSSIYT
ncbi:hypothetical protein BDV93DRAFT_163192 [Ceratobasidium sp. AG-I]|nr:hypothetical protein BDV93DRAFT_163192 [Ceratobasidium sp. AG-I]